MGKILVVLTNVDKFEKNGEATGLWLAEATDFVKPVTDAGYEVDYVSPKGGEVPIDPRSLEPAYVSVETEAAYHAEDFQTRALDQSIPAADINPADYDAIYYTGGHGVVFDFPEDERLQEISAAIYGAGGYVTSVCHGIAGLLNVKNSDGTNLIAGKKITGFTNMEELLSGKQELVPFNTEDEAKARGCNFVNGDPFTPYAVSDGRIITGQNPMSGALVAKKLLDKLSTE